MLGTLLDLSIFNRLLTSSMILSFHKENSAGESLYFSARLEILDEMADSMACLHLL